MYFAHHILVDETSPEIPGIPEIPRIPEIPE
jgi:hypothetical protein